MQGDTVNRLLLIGVIWLAGCSSIQSTPASSGLTSGLYYYMPKQDFVVTINQDKQGDVVTLGVSTPYPDLSHAYLLQYSKNGVGKNIMKIGLQPNGLLTSVNSEVQSGVTDALKGVASVLGTISALGEARLKGGKCAPGDNIWVIEAKPTITDKDLCGGHRVSVIRAPLGAAAETDKVVQPDDSSGIYYRLARPYYVKVSGTKEAEAILLSPSESATRFLPVPRAFFANSVAEMTFSDGMPTMYNIDTDGELVAALKLPAEVIKAYFDAMGAVFDSFSQRDSKQAAQLQAATQLELAKQKYQACLAAIKKNDTTTITSLGC